MAHNTVGFIHCMFLLLIVFSLISTYYEVHGHVVLTYPPARKYALDFLDNIRTRGPCGIPKGLGPVTDLTIGSRVNITWHVAYPHKGGYQLNLLDEDGRRVFNFTQRSSNSPYVNSNDPTRLHHEITVPNVSCTNCSIQIVRLAGEWWAGQVCGPDYLFWSCADVNLVPSQAGTDLCNGHSYENGACVCRKPYTGSRCQYKEDCFQDNDCGNHGKCIHTDSTYYPKSQCYCDVGWFGRNCEKESPVNSTDIDFSLYTSTNVSNEYQLSYRVLLVESEIEVVLRVKTATWVGLGWRPSGFRSGCQLFPALPGDSSTRPTSEPEPEKSTAEPEPEKSTAEPEPEKSTAEPEPEKSTAEPEPEKSTAEPEPEKSTAEPEPEKSTAEPEPEKSTPEPEPTQPSSCINVVSLCLGPTTSCIYHARIEYNQSDLNIQLSAAVSTTQWVGIGFSPSKSMPDSDIYTAHLNAQGNIIVDDRNIGQYKTVPPKDSIQNVYGVSGSYTNGRLSATFSRKRNTMDSQDALLTDYQCFYILMAWGGSTDASGNIGYHQSNRNVTQDEVCFGPCQKTTARPEPEQSTAEPEPEKSTAEPEPEKSTAEPEPEKSTAEPEPEKSTAEPEPEKSTAEPEPEKSTAEPEPEKSTAEPEPEKSTAEPVSIQPSSCTNVENLCLGPTTSCIYHARIEYNQTDLNIQLSAAVSTTQWVGIGFSSSKSMSDSDIYTAHLNAQGNIIVDDRNIGQYKTVPPKDSIQNVYGVSGSYTNGRLSAIFSRKRNTMDSQDALLTDYQCFYILMAWGGSTDASGNIGYHQSNRNVTQDEVCFGPCRNPGSTSRPEPTSEPKPESSPEPSPKTTPEPEEERVCGDSWKMCLSGPDSCDYVANWTYDEVTDTATFTVMAKVFQGEWFAIGFSNDSMMPYSDVYFGAYDSGNIIVTDRFTDSPYRAMPTRDPVQNHFGVTGSRVNGISTMTFSRKRNTMDTGRDFIFTDTDCAYFLFAWGGTYNLNLDFAGRHKHRFSSSKKICIKACDTPKPEPEKSTAEPEPEKSTAEPEPEKSTAEPEPEKSTAEPEPEKSTAEPEPEKSTAEPEPEKSTAEPEPEKSTAEPEPEKSTAEPEPEGSTAEPEGGTNGCGGRPAGASDTTGTRLENAMDCTDMVVASARGMRSRIGDYYTRGRSTPQHDEFYGGTQSLTAAMGFEENGYTTILFRKKLQASERTDHSIVNDFMNVIWARGQDAGNYIHRPPTGIDGTTTASDPNYYKDDELKYHGHDSHRGQRSLNFLQGKTYAPRRVVEVTVRILGHPWYRFYEDRSSVEFRNLHKDISDGLTMYLGANLQGFIQVRNITFSSGSIMVHFGIVFENNHNAVHMALTKLVQTEQKLQGYSLDPQVLQISDPEMYTDTDPVTTTTPAPAKTCEGTWERCNSATSICDVYSWSYNETTNLITFTIKVYLENNQWTALGFSNDQQMANTDVVLGYVKGDGTAVLEDRWAGGRYEPAKDSSNDVTLVSSSRQNKVTTLVFTRPPTTSEPDNDHQFTPTNCAYFMYAKGGTFTNTGRITMHDTTPIISQEKVCIPCPKPAVTTPAPNTNDTTPATTPTPTPAPTEPVYVIKAEFKILGHPWISEHGDRNSLAFKNLEKDLLKPLTDLFSQKVPGFDSIVIYRFRSGSIVVDFGILYRTLDQGATQTAAVRDTLNDIKQTRTIAGYDLDKDGFSSKAPEKYVEDMPTSTPPEEDELPVGLYIIIAVAAAGLLVVLILGVCNCVRTSRNKKQSEDDKKLMQHTNGEGHKNGVSRMSYSEWMKQQQMQQSYNNPGFQAPTEKDMHTGTMTFTDEYEYNSKL